VICFRGHRGSVFRCLHLLYLLTPGRGGFSQALNMKCLSAVNNVTPHFLNSDPVGNKFDF
jgi:hypothetical protein